MVAAKPAGIWKVLVTGEESGGGFALIEAQVRQGLEPPRRVHSREDVYVYVLDGCLTVDRDGERLERPAGTGLLLQRGSEHVFVVESDAARLLVWLSPAGFETCLAELDDLQPAGGNAGQVEHLIAIAARYGVAITGPARPP